jgi:hypothetical protein
MRFHNRVRFTATNTLATNNELERMRKEAVVAYSNALFQFFHWGSETTVVVTKLHVRRPQQNRTTLQHEQWYAGE